MLSFRRAHKTSKEHIVLSLMFPKNRYVCFQMDPRRCIMYNTLMQLCSILHRYCLCVACAEISSLLSIYLTNVEKVSYFKDGGNDTGAIK